MPKFKDFPKDKYHPYKDIDKNGVIIVTDFTAMEAITQSELLFVNISDHFTEKGLPPVDPDKAVTIDFQNRFGKALTPEDLNFVVEQIDKLYDNEIYSLMLSNVPNMTYNSLAGFDVSKEGSIQWERSDFEKIIAHIRMLYDSTLTKQ